MSGFGHHVSQHDATGDPLIVLTSTNSSAKIAPTRGLNLTSFSVDNQDYLVSQPSESVIPILGTPILYPTPNRVRAGHMQFDGREYRFPTNMRGHFIHGLVLDTAWNTDTPVATSDSVSVTGRITFEPGTPMYQLFPIRNTLEARLTLNEFCVRLSWRIINQDERWRLPFGLAIHPYFAIIGGRENTQIQIPAQKWMEAQEQMPSGKLLPLAKGPADLTDPTPLSVLDLDDVFWGMKPDKPATIFYTAIGKKLALKTSDFFTHCVVYTPPAADYFCIENQSCSTDAHNLHAQGLVEEAHLAILEPGESLEAWIEFEVSDL